MVGLRAIALNESFPWTSSSDLNSVDTFISSWRVWAADCIMVARSGLAAAEEGGNPAYGARTRGWHVIVLMGGPGLGELSVGRRRWTVAKARANSGWVFLLARSGRNEWQQRATTAWHHRHDPQRKMEVGMKGIDEWMNEERERGLGAGCRG